MTMSEVIPIVSSLSHNEKFRLMQIILAQLAKEEGIPLQATPAKRQDPLFDIIGIAEGENDDIARRHDDYLYGAS
jgi:non-ribosomal peptide synthetase component E (peptide arylation enzyme)